MKKNRIRLSSSTEKLEARNLLSSSAITSGWCLALLAAQLPAVLARQEINFP